MADKIKQTDRKEYRFKCGITAAQEECSLLQDKQLLLILKELDFKDTEELKNMKVADIINLLLGKEIIEKVLDVILIDVSSIKGWDKLKRSELVEVFEDFFTLSPVLTKWFGSGRSEAVSKLASAFGTKKTST
jgi:hypothetical protein